MIFIVSRETICSNSPKYYAVHYSDADFETFVRIVQYALAFQTQQPACAFIDCTINEPTIHVSRET